MKLDAAALRYLSEYDFRILTAVEMGMRNHELVPVPLIAAISSLKHGGYMKSLKEVHKHKLVHRESKPYVGYRLTSMGYDYLALNALVKRQVIGGVGRSIGVGKEADVLVVSASEQLIDEYPELADTPHLAMKLHRLGRTSFRAVKSKRDYLVHRKSASWIYFSRLAAMKEYAFMCVLHANGFPVPRPLGQSRHVVIMELCTGALLTQISQLSEPTEVANNLLEVVVRLARHGLVHCDLNEFNVLVDDEGALTVIDFPQMVSTRHANANALFQRDVDGIRRFFKHRFGVPLDEMIKPCLDDIIRARGTEEQLDAIVSASGFKNSNQYGYYGVQDTTEQEESQSPTGISMADLEIRVTEEEDIQESQNQVQNVSFRSDEELVSAQTKNEHSHNHNRHSQVQDCGNSTMDQKSSINRALIEARVRKQRANQAKRRHLSKKNVIKDSQKRKVKSEVECNIWN